MDDEFQFSVESARSAAEHDELSGWVSRFLASPGSDNAWLGQQLSKGLGWWTGPIRLPLNQLHRLAGPAGDPVLCPVDEGYWDDRVETMEERAEDGWEPPPVICAYRGNDIVLEDGNHRVEGLRQAGKETVWAVVGFERQDDRDQFVEEWG
jgi:hypothetical protein